MTRVFIRNFGLQENLSDLVVIRQKRVQTYHNYILVGNKLKYKGTREGGKSKTNIYIWPFPKTPCPAKRVASGGMIRGMFRRYVSGVCFGVCFALPC